MDVDIREYYDGMVNLLFPLLSGIILIGLYILGFVNVGIFLGVSVLGWFLKRIVKIPEFVLFSKIIFRVGICVSAVQVVCLFFSPTLQLLLGFILICLELIVGLFLFIKDMLIRYC